MKKYFYTLVLLPMLAVSCGGGGDTPVTPEPVVTYSVTIAGDSKVEITDEGDTYQFTASTDKPGVVNEYYWAVSDSEYAEIDTNGVLKPLKEGDVTITATLKADKSLKGQKTIRIVDETIESKYDELTKDEYKQAYKARYETYPGYIYESVTLDPDDKAYNLETLEEYNFTSATFTQTSELEYGAKYKLEIKYDVDGVTKTYEVYGAADYDHLSEYLEELEAYGITLYFYKHKDDKTLVIEGFDSEGLVYLHTFSEGCLIGTLIDYIPDETIPEKSVMAICHFTYEY